MARKGGRPPITEFGRDKQPGGKLDGMPQPERSNKFDVKAMIMYND